MKTQKMILNGGMRSSSSRNQIHPSIDKEATARLPVLEGEFKLHLYRDDDNKAHLALVMGDVEGKKNVLVRLHSECFTGDVLGSIRCDCGEQLHQSIKIISEEGLGIILYLKQEGRGIGLASKLHAYNLQDKGFDTVDANIALGHKADERNYDIVALILKNLGVESIRLLSNNPSKINSLKDNGINISKRIPLKPRITSENSLYLKTKISRMNHILDINTLSSTTPERETIIRYLTRNIERYQNTSRPFITLSYAQTLDGCISKSRNRPLTLSGRESLILIHQIRAIHDAILVGIGTVLSDNPQLTVRLSKGDSPRPIILDTHLKFPLRAKLLKTSLHPLIITGEKSDKSKQRTLEERGAEVCRLPVTNDKIGLSTLLPFLKRKGIESVMVEGGARVISSFIDERSVDAIISTITPFLMGDGLHALEKTEFDGKDKRLSLRNMRYVQIGRDLVVYGTPFWKNFE